MNDSHAAHLKVHSDYIKRFDNQLVIDRKKYRGTGRPRNRDYMTIKAWRKRHYEAHMGSWLKLSKEFLNSGIVTL